jgi:hypothetical protein
MRKLAILLGTLAIAASAFAGGKEPVAPEVTTVVKETVVYKSAKRGGFVDLSYWYTGPGSRFKEKSLGLSGYEYESMNDYYAPSGALRFEALGSLPLTEKDTLTFRVRIDTPFEESLTNGLVTPKEYTKRGDKTGQLRLQYLHKHDFLNATSRLQYRNTGADGYGWGIPANALEYRFGIPLEFLYIDSDFIKTKSFVIAPKVGYAWADSNDGGAKASWFGVDLESSYQLPLGFVLTLNLRASNYSSNRKLWTDKSKAKDYDGNFAINGYAILSNSITLVEWDNAKLSFAFDGGIDDYKISSRKQFASKYTSKAVDKSYYAFFNPYFRLDYTPVEDVTLYLQAGVEYGNGDFGAIHEAKNWSVSPEAKVGIKYSF